MPEAPAQTPVRPKSISSAQSGCAHCAIVGGGFDVEGLELCIKSRVWVGFILMTSGLSVQ